MNRTAGLVTALTMAFLATACGARTPTAGPIAPATPSAAPTASPLPTTAPTAEPTRACPAEPVEVDGELDLVTAQGHLTIQITPGTLEAPEPVDAAIVPVEATLVGGVHPTGTIQDDLAFGDGEISSISADFVPYGTTTVIPIDTSADGTTMHFDLPDADLSGRLRVAVAWMTRCTSGEGTGEIGLTIVNSSVVAGCPTTGAGLEDAIAALQEEHVTVGTAELPFIVVAGSARWFGGAVDSLVPQFAGWDRDLVVVVAPATSLLVKKAIDDLSAKSIRTTIYRRADVIDFLSDSTLDLRSVSVTNRTPGPKGNVGLPVPDAVGSYVYELQGQWQTPCLDVETYMVVTVEVR